jgi:hypothetical protein
MRNRLRYALAQSAAADELLGLVYGVNPFATHYYVDATNGNNTIHSGLSADKPFATWTKALSLASAGDVIFGAPGEYDEDVTVSLAKVALVGVGPRHSVRITGVAAGTSTAMTIDGVDDVALHNLNLEGRSGGGGLVINDVARRITLTGCRMFGGDIAASIVSDSSSVGWVTFDDCQFASAATGLSVTNSGGGISQQIVVRNSLFWSISTDCIVQSGFSANWVIENNTFASDSGTLPTRFLDIDDASTSGFVVGNYFAGSLWDDTLFKIAAGVFVAGNYTEGESGGGDASGTTGRPDA